ncbi:MAG TPA: hypothetical protein VFW96_04475 [Thermomicrobiales bacterium]|nr:hypothetical protein [Thermomicrobiales bacterium]
MAVIVPPPPGGRLVLDTGGLLAWVHGDAFARAMILAAGRHAALVVVPAIVIAQAIRGGPADAPVNRVLKQVDAFPPVTVRLARQAGVLLGATRTTDVADALVVAEALRLLPAVILTSDPGDIRRLVQSDSAHPRVRVVPV